MTVPSDQPSSFPTGFTSVVSSTWSTVLEPQVSAVADANAILSAAWSSSSAVVAVGYIQETDTALILRSNTGGSSWTPLVVRMTD